MLSVLSSAGCISFSPPPVDAVRIYSYSFESSSGLTINDAWDREMLPHLNLL